MTIENLDKHAVIKLRVGDYCNYRCPYCIRRDFIKDSKIMDLTPYIDDYNRLIEKLEQNTGKKVKVDLIGGEVTLYPGLNKLIHDLKADKINITTNGELTDVLLKLPKKNRVSLCVSLHPSQVKEENIDDWFEHKVRPLIGKFKYLQCETVAVYEADWIDDFKAIMERNEVPYKVEEDLLDPRCRGQACSSNKDRMRYRVTLDDGTVEEYPTRNMFLKMHGAKGGTCIKMSGLQCSRDFDYVYIEKDKVWTCHTEPIPIKDFELASDFHDCYKSPTHNCTLCGNISVRSKPCSET